MEFSVDDDGSAIMEFGPSYDPEGERQPDLSLRFVPQAGINLEFHLHPPDDIPHCYLSITASARHRRVEVRDGTGALLATVPLT